MKKLTQSKEDKIALIELAAFLNQSRDLLVDLSSLLQDVLCELDSDEKLRAENLSSELVKKLR
ncbi:hypothetical protein [Sapientia aquatica]|uniref:Uncharacterized protein n=1 Tax=Sapientia aquatica TaxID=1549640 RepID=A0A4R5W276_9BURK|nr:hypothetical protein [Sapientia aquatica]TDK66432.1 hypothetical protein E2I14_08130 [Sapientia aquatica]